MSSRGRKTPVPRRNTTKVYPPIVRATWFSLGAVLLAIAVAAGAFGAHALRSRLDVPSLALWDTAVRYLALGGLGLLAAGLAAARR